MELGDFSLRSGGFGTGVPGNIALDMCTGMGESGNGRRERKKERNEKREGKRIKHIHCTSYPNMVVVLFGPMNFTISTAWYILLS